MGRPATGWVRRARTKHREAWVIGIPLAPKPDGSRNTLTKTVYCSHEEAVKMKNKLLVEYGGRDLAGAAESMDNLFAQWIAAPGSSGRPRSSSSTYQETRRYERHVKPAFGHRNPRRVTSQDVSRLYQSLLQGGLSPNSVRRVHQLLSAMYTWGIQMGAVDVTPCPNARVPSAPLPPPTAPSPEQIDALLEAAERLDPEMLIVLRLAATTGARRSELVGLRWHHIDFDTGEIAIEAGEIVVPGATRRQPQRVTTDTKTGASAVLVLDRRTLVLLKKHRAQLDRDARMLGAEYPDDGYVFAATIEGDRAWHPDHLSTRMRELAAQVPGSEHVTLKNLRNFTATQMQGAGFAESAAQAVLRHRSRSTTTRHYQAAQTTSVRAATRHIGEKLGATTKKKAAPKKRK